MRRLRLILLCMGMMLAFSCSKEEDYTSETQHNNNIITPYGIFEGGW